MEARPIGRVVPLGYQFLVSLALLLHPSVALQVVDALARQITASVAVSIIPPIRDTHPQIVESDKRIAWRSSNPRWSRFSIHKWYNQVTREIP